MFRALLHTTSTAVRRRPRGGHGIAAGQRYTLALAMLILVLPGAASRADCSCLWHGSFVDVHPDTDLVVAATVESGRGNAIDIDVAQVLRGPDYLQRARVWLQAADYCRPPRELFPEGSTWVMALQRIDSVPEDGFNPNTPNISYGREGDYILSSCGGYWLKLTANLVSGALVKSPRWSREPGMTPVLLDVVAAHVSGHIDDEAILEASREDPAVKELMLDTREFLRSVRE